MFMQVTVYTNMQILVYTQRKCEKLSENASIVQSMQSKSYTTRNAYLECNARSVLENTQRKT